MIDWSKVKVMEMGQARRIEDIPDEEPTLEEQFKPVVLSPKSIDLASQLVPEQVWRKHGLHTWLTHWANIAFRRLKVGEKEVQVGKLRYFFQYVNGDPVLQKVVIA